MRDYDLPFKCGVIVGVDSTDARNANDLAIAKMLAAQSVLASSKGEELVLPEGVIYLNDTIVACKSGILRGQGAAGRNSATWLVFPADKTGILAGNIEHGPGTQATGLVLRDLGISSEFNGYHDPANLGVYTDLWTPDTVTAVDAIRNFSFLPVDDAATIGTGYPSPHPGMSYGYAYKCVAVTGDAKTGATYADEPEGENIYPLRTSAISTTTGNGVNPIVVTASIVKPNALCALTGHRLSTGMYVRISGVVGNTAANGIHQVTVTGADTFTIPVAGNGAYVSGGTVERVIRDDNVYWLPFEAHGVDVKARVVLDNVTITGFPGNQLNINASVNHPYYSNANLTRVMGGDYEQGGGSGIFIFAGDTANVTLVTPNCNQNRAFGWDVKAGSACTLIAPHGAINVMGDGRIYDTTAMGSYGEGSYRPFVVFGGGAQFLGGTPGGNSDLRFSGHYGAGSDPVTWSAGQVADVGQYVKPPADNGYIYRVTAAAGAKQLAAPPAFIPRGFGDLELVDVKAVVSGDCTLTPFAQSLVSTGEINLGTTRTSAKSFQNLIGTSKWNFYAGFTGETLGTTDHGPFGWAGPSSVDSGQAWGLETDALGYVFKRAHLATGGALGMTFGASPRSYSPNGHIFPDVPAAPAAPASGFVVYSEAGVLKKKDSAGVVTNL